MSRDRPKMAFKVIQNIAKFNKRKLPEDLAMKLLGKSNRKSKEETAEEDKTRYSDIDLFRSKSIAKITLLLILGWYVKTWVHVGSVIFRKYQNTKTLIYSDTPNKISNWSPYILG